MLSRGPESCIYRGTLLHHRIAQKRHAFRYGVYMVFVELTAPDSASIFSSFWLWSSDDRKGSIWPPVVARFSPKDYLSAQRVRELLGEKHGRELSEQVKRVFVLTNCRCFGFNFNSISIYYCYDAADRLIAALSEVHNTPWGEKIPYCHDFRAQPAGGPRTDRWRK